MLFFLLSWFVIGVFGTEYTLPGECPDVKLQENFDYTKFSGLWYNVASYASDQRKINDCSTMEFQEESQSYDFKETYVEKEEDNRTQKFYEARVDPTFDAGNKSKFMLSHEAADKVLQFPYFILSTDYDNYAIAYTCTWLRQKIRKHYVYTWVLTRSKDKPQGDLMLKIENALSKYTELAEHRQNFVFSDFSDAGCAYTNRLRAEFFTSNFW